MSPIDWQMVIIFMFGSDYWGKKQPELTWLWAFTLSMDPTICVLPSGSMKKAILGLAIYYLRQVGAASMIPPTRQKETMYSAHVLYRVGMAMMTFLGRDLGNIGLIISIRSTPGSSCFFFRFWSGLIVSTFKCAWPLPLNSSSILKIHYVTYKFLAISWANEWMNSCSS